MYLLLLVLLSVITLGLLTNDKKNKLPIQEKEEVIEKVIPSTFCKSFNNIDNLPIEVVDLIKNYMDDFYKSMYTLEQVSVSSFFNNDFQAALSEYSTKIIIESRKLSGDDFSLTDAYYTLDVANVSKIDDDTYSVDILEDDYLNFKCLDGITSETLDVENNFVIKRIENEYKIESHEKVQSQNTIFEDAESVDEVVDTYNKYYDNFKLILSKEESYRVDAQKNPYVSTLSCEKSYDHKVGATYASTYYKERNEEYIDYSEYGGNCQNLASQALIAGGLLMDEYGDYQWYYRDSTDNSISWRTVLGFEEYISNNTGSGLVAEELDNIYYAEPGDIVHVGHSLCSHATIVSKIVNGHILLNSNSIDMKDFPLEAYVYANRKLIKILGYNS